MKTTHRVDKRELHVRKKLSAAILMLLISCIMTVTSTYAWFTLSTAPEVTGIQTTIGGNGNLEIALANSQTWANPSEVSTLAGKSDDIKVTNASWGNLIDVSPTLTEDPYGINKLVLSPARLNAAYATDTDGKTDTLHGDVDEQVILNAPKFGADGRVSELLSGMTATYDGSSFTMGTGNDYGVRAIGISTAMTARQSAFMTARSVANQKSGLAKNGTSAAMNKNGGMLGNLAVVLATADDRDKVSFTNTEYDAIKELITETEAAVKNIDSSIMSLIDAVLASANSKDVLHIDDTMYKFLSSALQNMTIYDEANHTAGSDITVSGNTVKFNITSLTEAPENTPTSVDNEALATLISTYLGIREDITEALNALPARVDGEAQRYYWGAKEGVDGSIGGAVNKLMNMDGAITVGGKTIDDLKEIISKKDMTQLLALANNLNVNLGAGSGIYYDIATLVGTIQANILIDITYNGITMEDTPASISSKYDNALITTATSLLKSPSSDGSAEASRISDIYGYALDLLFRTNASDSSLLLQTTPTDRIYSDNANEETMGAGSTMTFKKTVASFTDAQMLNLMKAIKVVFMADDGTILGVAGLDTGSTVKTVYYTDADKTNISNVQTEYTGQVEVPNYTVNSADGTITVDIRMIHGYDASGKALFITDDAKTTITTVVDKVDAQGNKIQATDKDGNPLYQDDEKEIPIYETETKVEEVELEPEICELTQNTAKKVSVVVYLDGDTVTNADVANAATSMTGTMNLQFASNADLTPMEYSGLHVTNPAEPTPTPEAN